MSLAEGVVALLHVEQLVLHVDLLLPVLSFGRSLTGWCSAAVTVLGIPQLLPQEGDLSFQTFDQRVLVALIGDLLDPGFTLNSPGALRILHGVQGFTQVELSRGNTSNHVGVCISAQRILQQTGEFRIPV